MKRFNYLADNRRPVWTSIAPRIAIDNRIRGPLAALILALIVTGALSLIQLSRLHAAQRAYDETLARVAVSTASIDALKALRARVALKTRLAADIANVRRVNIVHANELTWIGNRLPQDTWLSVLRFENGSYSLEGTANRVATVGNAILALHEDGATVPRLVSLHDDSNSSGPPVHYTLRLEPHS